MAFYSKLAGMISSLSYTTIKLSRNIVQHKQAEEALKASRDLLNATQKIAKVGGWEWEMATDTVTWSEELYTITGLDPNFLHHSLTMTTIKYIQSKVGKSLLELLNTRLRPENPTNYTRR